MNFVIVDNHAINLDKLLYVRYEPMNKELVFSFSGLVFSSTPTRDELLELQTKIGVTFDYGID